MVTLDRNITYTCIPELTTGIVYHLLLHADPPKNHYKSTSAYEFSTIID